MDTTPTRENLIDIVERLLRSQGRLTSGESMDLDYCQELLDEWFAKHDAALTEKVLTAPWKA